MNRLLKMCLQIEMTILAREVLLAATKLSTKTSHFLIAISQAVCQYNYARISKEDNQNYQNYYSSCL